jgi:DNA-binding IclR family transcriptional regulator
MLELETIQEQQFAIDHEEFTKGLQSVAAPITSDSTVIGAIGVSGPISRLEDNRLTDDLATEVQRVANVIEINSIFSE